MKIKWTAKYILGGWFNRFTIHGETEVPVDASEATIARLVRNAVLSSFRITIHRDT